MPDTVPDDTHQQTQATGEIVLRHHLCWKRRDLDGVMAHYHPDIQYNDFFQNRVVGFAELREYLRASMPRDQAMRPTVSRLGLSPQQLSYLANDLQQYFQHQQPYLDPELDLQRVAKECGYSRNQISYLLNQVLGQSFYRYVNQTRLQHLLATLDKATPPIRIDELAFAAGFNSLSAFYSCFRQHTGLSPKAYVKQISLRARAQDAP
ncbi:helix-turn-helix domain-containing protein [Pseudomonas sp. ANT_H14]|uniref:helix-turn-helix domain-containing protein n=1 Tax=unclassified Pseudomonas TaxID=196821 RepID=UPI0011EE065F|nr:MULTISPECIES: helix-turn-helix domain-containing protein [unclassified Pseudomonas]KAA0943549.1 helix-turn-helix domain-containing protein [Pseudomonas sp. ANT_H4]KAA0950027.1 helix-turn-helix domain-containing protein [Pseudomonas sp. ANT_H14]